MRVIISERYFSLLAILFALTLLPVGVHSYVKLRGDECTKSEELAAGATQDGDLQRNFDTEQAWRGVVTPASGPFRLEYAVIRSYNAKRLYYRPEQRFLKRAKPDDSVLDWIEDEGERLPIHRLQYQLRGSYRGRLMVAYLLAYEGKPIRNGYLAQLTRAPLQLLRGRRPMTLFIVFGTVAPKEYEHAEAAAQVWLGSAWQRYRSLCGS